MKTMRQLFTAKEQINTSNEAYSNNNVEKLFDKRLSIKYNDDALFHYLS